MSGLTRRRLLAGGSLAGASAAILHSAIPHRHPWDHDAKAAESHHAGATDGHAAFHGGVVDPHVNGFDPHETLRSFDWGTTRRLASGRVLREWEISVAEQEIEVAPGVKFQAWTYNQRIPGPTLRAREGERLRITLLNRSHHPHTMHFHGIHPAEMDGVPGVGAGAVPPGGQTVYEFDAQPFGLHLYHCHVRPLAEHIAKGLYGAFIIDPKDGRPDADEMVLVMHGFDTNFDRENEIYAVNGPGFAYMDPAVAVRRDDLVRVYIVNATEFDPINSFHLHGNLFNYFPSGTSTEPAEYTDTVMLCQGQRGIAEWRFQYPGRYMFHAHQSEFTELGWQGFFEVNA